MNGKHILALDLISIKGIGKETANLLELSIACKSIFDLLYYFPRRYLDRTIIDDESKIQIGQEGTLIIKVNNTYMHHHAKVSRLVCNCETLKGLQITLVWFGSANYFYKKIYKGQNLLVSGRIEYYKNSLQIAHPDFFILSKGESEADLLEESLESIEHGRIIPIYPLNEKLKDKKITNHSLRKWIKQAIDMVKKENALPEIIDANIIQKNNFIKRIEALEYMHFPKTMETLKQVQVQLKYEELFLFQMMMYERSRATQLLEKKYKPLKFGESIAYKNLLQTLPFSLTPSQDEAIKRILDKVQNSAPSSFLLQGDVGSGKTIIALAISLHYMELDLQVALVAPTEVLARQHFLNISEFLGLHWAAHIALLVSSVPTIEKKEIIDNLSKGQIKLIIGTHSLFDKDVIFKNLALIVIDEQQRFGVRQREALSSKENTKANNPDTISMSATPIPRSLCLTEFSDLELILLKEKPVGRKPIQTLWLNSSKRKGLYNSIRKYIKQGQQCFIVYPIIEESEKTDLQAAKNAYETLSQEVFPEFKISLLHSQLKDTEKIQIMRSFKNGSIQILISTSIIEVGVDVPNASIIVIENAERFGVSQLHQMRGRVGRSNLQSFCILVSDAKGEDTKERLNALVASQDGFYLADVDLKIRGTGEILGVKQHGWGEFRLANLIMDKELCESSHKDVRFMYQQNNLPIPEHIHKEMVQRFPNTHNLLTN